MSCNVPRAVGTDEKWLMSMCVTVSLLALLGAFQQWLKGLVGLSISIPACPASPLPGWEVFYFQKLEHGAKIKVCES